VNGRSDDETSSSGAAALLELLQAMRRHTGTGADQIRSLSFDEETVRLWRRDAAGDPVLHAEFAWDAVMRICFKDNGPLASDHLYVRTRERRAALVVPLEAVGGGDFWRQLPARGLFPAWLHEKATLSMDGRFYCWPPLGRGAWTEAG
jgi:hypothetical protein